MKLNSDKDGQRKSQFTAIGTYAGIGLELATAIIVFLLAGRYIDGRLGTEPWLMILGTALGFAIGFYSMFRTLSGLSAKEEQKGPGG